LPVQSLSQVIERRVAPSIEAARAENRLVLAVDDHPTNRMMLARQLNTLGYAVQTAADGHEALQHYRGGGVALIVTDCQMPGMDGFQLACAIRDSETSGKRLPIVACTANVSQESIDLCRAAGMDDVLTKPIELAVLNRALDRWFQTDCPDVRRPGVAGAHGCHAIEKLTEGDTALEYELFAEFRRVNDQDLEATALAVQGNAAGEVRRMAHRIKGAAGTLGASALSEMAARLEQAANNEDWKSIVSNWAALRDENERLIERIEKRCAEIHESSENG
jgi:CheY-like chemotaxis protein